MNEGIALFITTAIGVILVGLFFRFFMKKYEEKQKENDAKRSDHKGHCRGC